MSPIEVGFDTNNDKHTFVQRAYSFKTLNLHSSSFFMCKHITNLLWNWKKIITADTALLIYFSLMKCNVLIGNFIWFFIILFLRYSFAIRTVCLIMQSNKCFWEYKVNQNLVALRNWSLHFSSIIPRHIIYNDIKPTVSKANMQTMVLYILSGFCFNVQCKI